MHPPDGPTALEVVGRRRFKNGLPGIEYGGLSSVVRCRSPARLQHRTTVKKWSKDGLQLTLPDDDDHKCIAKIVTAITILMVILELRTCDVFLIVCSTLIIMLQKWTNLHQ